MKLYPIKNKKGKPVLSKEDTKDANKKYKKSKSGMTLKEWVDAYIPQDED